MTCSHSAHAPHAPHAWHVSSALLWRGVACATCAPLPGWGVGRGQRHIRGGGTCHPCDSSKNALLYDEHAETHRLIAGLVRELFEQPSVRSEGDVVRANPATSLSPLSPRRPMGEVTWSSMPGDGVFDSARGLYFEWMPGPQQSHP